MLGKQVYNDAGQEVGRVEDLIVSPRGGVSLLIVSAGGFVGIGRHDVAVPFSQVEDRGGKLMMRGTTRDAVARMPSFEYANNSAANRDQFIAATGKDIVQARAALGDVQKKAGVAASDMKGKLDAQASALVADVKTVQGRLDELKRASTSRWQESGAQVRTAVSRMNKSLESARG